jgi:hypothetical protein
MVRGTFVEIGEMHRPCSVEYCQPLAASKFPVRKYAIPIKMSCSSVKTILISKLIQIDT